MIVAVMNAFETLEMGCFPHLFGVFHTFIFELILPLLSSIKLVVIIPLTMKMCQSHFFFHQCIWPN